MVYNSVMRRFLHLQDSLVQITIALNLFGFASQLVGVFIPLVILQHGGKLWQVPAFYLLYAVIKLTINYPSALLIQKRGAHFGLGMSFVSGALQILAILGYSASQHVVYLFLSAAALSITNAFLWNSQHLYISKVMAESTKSSNIAVIANIGQIVGIVAPLLGGLIGQYLGADYLLATAVIVSLAAVYPLSKMEYIVEQNTQKIKYNFSGAPARDIVANFCYNIETQVGVTVWPIYLAVTIATFRGIGLITAIAAAVSMLVTWLAGHRGDRGKDRAVLREGVAISSVIDIIRIFATTHFWITFVSAAYKASLAYLINSWTSTYYHHAKRNGLQYIMSMEIANDLAFVGLWSVLLVVLAGSNKTMFFNAAFILAAIAAWGCLFITRQGSLERDS